MKPGAALDEGTLPAVGLTARSCDTKSSSLTAPLLADSGLPDMLAEEGWTDDQALALDWPPRNEVFEGDDRCGCGGWAYAYDSADLDGPAWDGAPYIPA